MKCQVVCALSGKKLLCLDFKSGLHQTITTKLTTISARRFKLLKEGEEMEAQKLEEEANWERLGGRDMTLICVRLPDYDGDLLFTDFEYFEWAYEHIPLRVVREFAKRFMMPGATSKADAQVSVSLAEKSFLSVSGRRLRCQWPLSRFTAHWTRLIFLFKLGCYRHGNCEEFIETCPGLSSSVEGCVPRFRARRLRGMRTTCKKRRSTLRCHRARKAGGDLRACAKFCPRCNWIQRYLFKVRDLMGSE